MDNKTATQVFECLASPVRLDVFKLLVKQGPAGLVAGEIASLLNLPATNLSFHLKNLTQAGLLSVEQEGRYLRYRADIPLMLELGRSFVQPRYWGKRSLDYLWFGIGAYVRRYPECRYLFGPVTISRDMPPAARDLLIYHYRNHYGAACLAHARRPYLPVEGWEVCSQFSGEDVAADFVRLKHLLAHMGSAVPTLFKQYAEVAQPGGVRFLDFGVDPDFSHCVDGLVLVDVDKLKPHKRARYMGETAAQSGD